MKLHKISIILMSAFIVASCSDIDDQTPEGGVLTEEQVRETNEAIPARIDATFSGMFTMMATPGAVFGLGQSRADDFGFISAALSQDAEGADLGMADNGYNWFSTACELSSRNANYANPYARYTLPYRQIGVANQIISSYDANTTDKEAINKIAQARAIRAFDYMALAPYYAFGDYEKHKNDLCIPVLSDSVDMTNNPRATLEKVYEAVMSDLNYAVEKLEGAKRSDKAYIDQNVAYGLRARANLAMGRYAEAAADAEKAMNGYKPASRAQVSVPTFYDITESNWIWGVDITDAQVTDFGYATSSSWLSAFSGDGYAPATGNVPVINKLLYDKISANDVRKGWWLNEDKHSPNWANLSWDDVVGDEIADYVIEDVKVKFLPYTNIKFGQKSGVGSSLNNNDWPLMRVEEMILIQAEGLARSGNESRAKEVLTNFVKTYRDPSYNISATGRTLLDEIWFQRRVELWGEGFFTADAKRLGKNIVRFHGKGTSNFPDAHQFNIAADDGWLNLRFPQDEKDNNLGIIDNTGGTQPVPGQNANLRDGVTD